MVRTNGDLDAANRHMQRRRQRIETMRRRAQRQRDRRRQLDLLVAGVLAGIERRLKRVETTTQRELLP